MSDEMTKGDSALYNIFKQIDWGASTIGIISNFKDAMQQAKISDTLKDIYQGLMETMIQESGGMTGLLEDLIYSEDFKKSLKTI